MHAVTSLEVLALAGICLFIYEAILLGMDFVAWILAKIAWQHEIKKYPNIKHLL